MKLLIIIGLLFGISFAQVSDDYLNNLKQQALQDNPNFKGFDIDRGKQIFTSKHIGKKGKEISCISCHTNDFTKNGENFFTGKSIEPLSPKTNPKRFSEIKTIEKWLKRNFNDVYNRVGTAQEKGDVVVYILHKGNQ